MKIECPVCHNALECESEWSGQKAQCPFCKNKFIINDIMLAPAASAGRSKWIGVLSGAAAVLCVAAGLGLGHVLFAPDAKPGSGQAAAPETATAVAEDASSAATEVAMEKTVEAAPAATENAAAVTDESITENNAEASQESEQSSEETTVSAEDGNYTYE